MSGSQFSRASGSTNAFNFANFDYSGNALSGLLGIAANGPASAVSRLAEFQAGTVRSDRIGVGSGLFQYGQPQGVIEWGLKLPPHLGAGSVPSHRAGFGVSPDAQWLRVAGAIGLFVCGFKEVT